MTSMSFDQAMNKAHVSPLWRVLDDLVPNQPTPASRPAIWKYNALRPLLMDAGNLVTAEEAIRRVLILENPGTEGSHAVSGSLYAGLQLVLPGELAPCHRHSQAAIRFVLEGNGAFTSVNGEPVIMSPYDLILTPPGDWHDHENPSDEPIVWLDGLDIPLLQHFEVGFHEGYSEKIFPRQIPSGSNTQIQGRSLSRISNSETGTTGNRLLHYPYTEYSAALNALAGSSDPDPHHGYKVEFNDPRSGGPVLNTMSAFAQLIPANFTTETRRTTEAQVFCAVNGSGNAFLGEEVFEYSERDVFVAPPWVPVQFATQTDSILFSFTDKAAKQALGLFREELNFSQP